MAIETLIIEEIPNGLRTMAVKALLKDEQVVKRVEVQLEQGANAAAYVAANAAALWPGAVDADMTWWLAIRERHHRAYYYAIMRAVEIVRASGGTLDMALAAGLAAIANNTTKAAEFGQWRTMCQLTEPQTTSDKRDLLALIVSFCSAGLIGGAKL